MIWRDEYANLIDEFCVLFEIQNPLDNSSAAFTYLLLPLDSFHPKFYNRLNIFIAKFKKVCARELP